MQDKKCVICGADFTAKGHKARYCSEACRQIGIKQNYVARRKKIKEDKNIIHTDHLTNVAAEARKNNLSYGEYQAQKYRKKVKVRKPHKKANYEARRKQFFQQVQQWEVMHG